MQARYRRTPGSARASRLWIGALAALLGSAGTAAAQTDPPEEDTYETARGMGLGTGARASAIGTSAAAYNAANLGQAQLYHIESDLGFTPGGGGWWVGGAVVDSVSSPLAAGMSFRGMFDLGEDDHSGFDGRVSLGYALSDAIGLGLAGRYIKLEPDSQDAGDPGAKGFTLDASVRVTPTDGLHIAALGYNLIDRNSALTPMMVGGSLSFAIKDAFTLGGDGLVDLSTFDRAAVLAGGGFEYLAGGAVPLRLGYRFDSGRDTHSVTGSLGYVDKSVGLDVALRQHVAGAKDTQLLFTFRYHVQ